MNLSDSEYCYLMGLRARTHAERMFWINKQVQLGITAWRSALKEAPEGTVEALYSDDQ